MYWRLQAMMDLPGYGGLLQAQLNGFIGLSYGSNSKQDHHLINTVHYLKDYSLEG
jgi:hypothetical protein